MRNRLKLLALLSVLSAGSVAAAQSAVQQNGRLFDANPSVLGGRINGTIRPASRFLGGNLTASGNVRFGQSLRINSPVGSPLGVRTALPSGGLSGFVRDSFSLSDRGYGSRGTGPQAYYNTSLTAPTTGFLLGQNNGLGVGAFYSSRNATTTLALPGQLTFTSPLVPRPFAQSSTLPARSNISSAAPGDSLYGSALFGVQPLDWSVDLSALPDVTQQSREMTTLRSRVSAIEGRSNSIAGVHGIDYSIPSTLLSTPLEFKTLASDPLSSLRPTGATPPPLGVQARPALDPTIARGTRGASAPPGIVVGDDLFHDLRLAEALHANPTADWTHQLRASLGGDASEATRIVADQGEAARLQLERLRAAPLQSLAGRPDDEFDQRMLRAEALVEQRRYYDAVTQYKRAATLAPENPLPHLGRGHALLAAGDYASATVALHTALSRYPRIAKIRIDLTALLGGGETVDIRRADLMRLLEVDDDARLRFLLGYLEFHSGRTERGMNNLRRAAELAPIDSLISRYPNMLAPLGASTTPPAGTNE